MTSSNGHAHTLDTKRIGIVGGGFSGAAVAYHLARSARGRLDIIIYEPRDRIGHGVAYSTPGAHMLLNVPAGKLSIDPARPADFLDWCVTRGHRADPEAFLARSLFGAYAESRMADQIQATDGRVTLQRVASRVDRIDDDAERLQITDSSGCVARVDHAVLALGHGPTRIPEAISPFSDSPQVLHSPWEPNAMAGVAEQARRVLLVGTGLTMCDAAITLARMGFRGELTAISRRGLLPQVHGPSDPSGLAGWAARLRVGSFRELRREVRRVSRKHGWRSAVDALRRRTSSLWGAMNRRDQDRFIRRLAPYWEAHRHRLPAVSALEINALREAGSLRIVRGLLRRVQRNRAWLTCELQPHGDQHPETLHADAIVLCTGPDPDPRRWKSPLIDQLMADGLASPETNGLGLRTSNAGLLIGRGDVVQQRLSTLGPLRRGSLWESTAVPEIAAQASVLGRHLTDGNDRTASLYHLSFHQTASLTSHH